MIVRIPTNTQDLFKELEEGTNRLNAQDRNTFTLDLIKFCIDWQFALLAMKDAEQ